MDKTQPDDCRNSPRISEMKSHPSLASDLDRHLSTKRPDSVLDYANRVLASDPGHREAASLLKKIRLAKNVREKRTGDTVSVYGYINPDNGLTMEEAQELYARVTAGAETDDEGAMVNAASQLLLSGAFAESIKAYELIMSKYPASQGSCLTSIGACHFFLGDYEKAVECYLRAGDAGAPAAMIEDNIFEAAETDFQKNKRIVLLEKYLSLYPEGRYARKAKEIR